MNVISPEAEKGERNSSGHTCCLLTWADLTDIITAFSYGVDGLLLPRSQYNRQGLERCFLPTDFLILWLLGTVLRLSPGTEMADGEPVIVIQLVDPQVSLEQY